MIKALPQEIEKKLPQEVLEILSVLDQIEEHTNNVRKKLFAELGV